MNGYERLQKLPEADLRLLKERAKALAEATVSTGEETQDLVELMELESCGQRFAIPLTSVEGIADLTAIATAPRTPPACRGIVAFRGEMMFGMELGALLGSGTTGIADLRRLIVLAAGGLKLALLAERVSTVRSARLSSFLRDRLRSQPSVVGVDSDFVSLLDPVLLIQHAFRTLEGAPT